MSKQLFRVDISAEYSSTIMVVAEDIDAAREIGVEIADDGDIDFIRDDYTASASPVHRTSDIPRSWRDDSPYSHYSTDAEDELSCLDWLRRFLLSAPMPPDTRQLKLGEHGDVRTLDAIDRKCKEYSQLLTSIGDDDYTAKDLDRCCELANDPEVQRRLEEARTPALAEEM